MDDMTNSGKIFSDDITTCLIDTEGFKNPNENFPYTISMPQMDQS